MTFKILIISCFLWSLFKTSPVEINQASVQKVYGGVQGSGIASEYRLNVSIKKKPQKLSFSGVIINGKFIENIKIIPQNHPQTHFNIDNQHNYLTKAEKNDTVTLSFAIHQNKGNQGNMIPPPKNDFNIPNSLKGKDLLIVQWRNKNKFIEIRNIASKEPIYMP